MNRTGMIGHILNRDPGIYLHISFNMFWWLIFIATICVFAFLYTVDVRFNRGPLEYPMFIDGKKITFMGREPQSVTEAREILSSYKHKVQDGDKVLAP